MNKYDIYERMRELNIEVSEMKDAKKSNTLILC